MPITAESDVLGVRRASRPAYNPPSRRTKAGGSAGPIGASHNPLCATTMGITTTEKAKATKNPKKARGARRAFKVEVRTAGPLPLPPRTRSEVQAATDAVSEAYKKFVVGVQPLRERDPGLVVHPRGGAIFPIIIIEAVTQLVPLIRKLPGVRSVTRLD